MNKAILIKRIAAEAEVTHKQAKNMLYAMMDIIIKELQAGNEVILSGFGTFLTKKRHARMGVDPQNPSQKIKIPEVTVAKFRTGKRLKDALK